MLRSSALVRHLPASSRPAGRMTAAAALGAVNHAAPLAQQARGAHAISNPTLANIEKRWEAMPPQEQADLWMALRDRMKADWNELTLQEKKAAYWIAFGPHGPRAEAPPGETRRVLSYTLIGLGISTAVFLATHHFAKGAPPTMNKEWQEATNAYFQENRIEPITGPGAEGYQGKGMVQSAPKSEGH